ncbi:hypothetical protein [Aliiroseovarius sp. F20344]|uniref:hypothetical protein n=1 Tax=Aliiroseovarius sp. F20344 TaxID=2926414 RepID=UPI001FF69549|nr:hypothetical protein [Aliiroseovarius sp. F20344]MCK0143681.1 hypothetical protein [Aliiroseovarius sp. F20344]
MIFRNSLATRLTFALILSTLSLPAFAQECLFETECYEADACQETAFSLTADLDGERLITDFGDLTIVAAKQSGALTTIFSTGDGAEYLLSRNGDTARFTAHANDGPTVITYLGTCKGEF